MLHHLSRNLHNYFFNLQNLLHCYLFIVGFTIQLYNFCTDIVGLTIQLQKSSNFLVRQRTLVLSLFAGYLWALNVEVYLYAISHK